MGGAGRSQSQERGREIAEGSGVVVLSNRNFTAFGAGDEGVVLRIDKEAQTCQVQFNGKPQPVQVALRHLRATSAAPAGAARRASSSAAAPRGPPGPRGPGREAEACAYMDSAAGFAAGVAAVAGAPGQRAAEPVAFPAYDPCGHPGQAEALQQSRGPWGGGFGGLSRDQSTLLASQPGTPYAMINFPPDGHALGQNGFLPHAAVNHAIGGQAGPDPMGHDPAVQWRAARLEALEARLSCIEEEHRQEVASLRYALEECVRAIGTCAQAIDTMCADSAEAVRDGAPGARSQAAPGRVGVVGEWERAAAALHNAASLGMRALGAEGGGAVDPPAGREGAPAHPPPGRLAGPAGAPVDVEVQRAAAPALAPAGPPLAAAGAHCPTVPVRTVVSRHLLPLGAVAPAPGILAGAGGPAFAGPCRCGDAGGAGLAACHAGALAGPAWGGLAPAHGLPPGPCQPQPQLPLPGGFAPLQLGAMPPLPGVGGVGGLGASGGLGPPAAPLTSRVGAGEAGGAAGYPCGHAAPPWHAGR